jgi:hypothetical protein
VFIFYHLDLKSLIGLVNQLACKLTPIYACELVSKFVELVTCKSWHHSMNCHMQIYVTSCLQTYTFYKWIYVRISIEKWGHSLGAPSFFYDEVMKAMELFLYHSSLQIVILTLVIREPKNNIHVGFHFNFNVVCLVTFWYGLMIIILSMCHICKTCEQFINNQGPIWKQSYANFDLIILISLSVNWP